MRSPYRTLSSAGRTGLATAEPRLLRDIALVCLADGVVGMSFGAIAVAGGLPLWVSVAMSLLVFAGAAQFSAVGILLAGGGPVSAVATGLLLNTRTAAFGLAVADALGRSWPARLVGAHLVTDETAAFALSQRSPEARKAAFWISGVALFAVWNAGVLIGALAGTALGDPGRLGLDAAYPAVLLALVLPALREDRSGARAATAGAAVALAATPLFPAGIPVLLSLTGLLASRRRSGKGGTARPEDPGDGRNGAAAGTERTGAEGGGPGGGGPAVTGVREEGGG
ncbi:branched-chain amino acid ABC transporter permease [Streptomyces sp. SID4919]|uniref:AzlC family ABC transporter permease n=1 Tax=Streptomyces sp. SID4919 TaxID=2690270 RepID=UPI0008237A23|nr:MULTISPECIES: AzlC family ABC transporter permease [unclassified Streptomyces]MYY10007.1 branched-chain amino acid ABC transporter permease [Streptomyces sp. SID4919]SCK63536.1 4-azaleucine resistance probable transporter AzlC [Streptomyces sp. AmelKG-E11A]